MIRITNSMSNAGLLTAVHYFHKLSTYSVLTASAAPIGLLAAPNSFSDDHPSQPFKRLTRAFVKRTKISIRMNFQSKAFSFPGSSAADIMKYIR